MVGRGPRVFLMDLLAIVPYYTAYLGRALQEAGVDVTVGSITYYLDPGCLRGRGLRAEPGLVDVVGRYRLPRWPRRLLKMPEAMVNLLALAGRWGVRPPEVVHVQFLPMLRWPAPADWWLVRWARRRGAKVVLTVHDILPHDTGARHREVYGRLYRDVDALICHSTAVEGRLREEFGVPAERIAVIPHGPFFFDLESGDGAAGKDCAATRARFGVPEGAAVVLWQGIVFPYKGVDLLLAAWRRVEEENGAWLVVAGTGGAELLAELEGQARSLDLGRVRFVPRFLSTEELVALYRVATVVVYPYRAITTSGALATGLALGKAIVASDLPVFREVLEHGETSLLVDAADAEGLARAIRRVLDDTELRERMEAGVRGMGFGASAWGAIGRATVAVYERVLGRDSRLAGR